MGGLRCGSVTFSLLALIGASTITAQTEPRSCAHCKGGWAFVSTVAEISAINLLVVGFHRYHYKDDEYGISAPSGQRLDWDASAFYINQFGHPYHGGLYYSSARAHGLSYWAGLPFTFFGSLTWETFMDPEMISANDLVATTVGGAAFGESTYRLSTAVLQAQTLGGGFATGLLAFLLNPIGGVHELVDGPTFRVREGSFRIATRFNAGGRVVTTPTGSRTTTVYELEFDYGDYFTGDKLGPFDAFEVTGRLNLPEPRPVADFHIAGVLAGGPVGSQTGSWRHTLGLFQHLDYYHPEGTQYGGQSVGAGLRSLWHLGDNLDLRLSSDLNWMIAGAASSEFYSERIPRDYDHGTGVGFKLSAQLGNSSFAFGRVAYSGNFMHTFDGPSDNHFIHFVDASVFVPLFRVVGVGFAYQWYSRRSDYPVADFPDIHRSESEVRVHLAVAFN